MRFKEKLREDPKPDLTSLTDIMFILIIFLTVTTTFAGVGGLNVNLPESSSERRLEETDKVFVVIDRHGAAFVDGRPISDTELAARFAAMAQADDQTMVIIQADKIALHGRVVTVMDLAQTAGLRRLAIATDQKLETAATAPTPAVGTGPAVPGPAPPAPGATAP